MREQRVKILTEKSAREELERLHQKNLSHLEGQELKPVEEDPVTFGIPEAETDSYTESSEGTIVEQMESWDGNTRAWLGLEGEDSTGEYRFSVSQPVELELDLPVNQMLLLAAEIEESPGIKQVAPEYSAKAGEPLEAYTEADYCLSFYAGENDYGFLQVNLEGTPSVADIEAQDSETLGELYSAIEATGIEVEEYRFEGEEENEWMVYDDDALVDLKR